MTGLLRPRPWLPRLLDCLAVATLAVVVFAAPALAHEGEKSTPARTLAQIAVAIIRTQPDQIDAAADKINDAIEAEDHTGLDVALVEQAQQALGACPGQPVTNPNPKGIRGGLPARITACPAPQAHELGLGRRPTRGAARVSLLAVGAVLVAGGLVLSRRIR